MKICPKWLLLGTSGVIWGDQRTFGVILECRSQCVIRRVAFCASLFKSIQQQFKSVQQRFKSTQQAFQVLEQKFIRFFIHFHEILRFLHCNQPAKLAAMLRYNLDRTATETMRLLMGGLNHVCLFSLLTCFLAVVFFIPQQLTKLPLMCPCPLCAER